MKVIAKTNSKFLIEASEKEINLMLGKNKTKGDISVGYECDVCTLNEINYFVRTLGHIELDTMRKKLQRLSKQVEEFDDFFNKLHLAETIKDFDNE